MDQGRWRRVGKSLAAVGAALYGPFLPLLLGTSPEAAARWFRLGPILPGFVPGAYLGQAGAATRYAVMGVMTLGLLASLISLGSGGGRRLGAAVGTALLVSVPSAIIAYLNFPS